MCGGRQGGWAQLFRLNTNSRYLCITRNLLGDGTIPECSSGCPVGVRWIDLKKKAVNPQFWAQHQDTPPQAVSAGATSDAFDSSQAERVTQV